MAFASDHPFAVCILNATRLRRSHRLSYMQDVRWLFRLELERWQKEIGVPLRLKQPEFLSTRLRRSDACVFDVSPYTYPTGIEAAAFQTIDADFCISYGFDDYSAQALNYANINYKRPGLEGYLCEGSTLLGSFAVALDRRPTGHIPCLPDPAIQCVARVEWPHGKTLSVQAWLGVWIDAPRLSASLVQALGEIPSDAIATSSSWPPLSSAYITQFMRYFGHLGGEEEELRERLGFPKKGQPTAEKILLRSVHEVFSGEEILHRYRGREMGGLELDIFLPQRKLAFEYQGEQHSRHVPHWHGDAGLQAQHERDERKRALCKRLGYTLLYVHPGADLRREGVVQMLRKEKQLSPEYGDEEAALCVVPPKDESRVVHLPSDMSRAEAIDQLQGWWRTGRIR